MEATLNFPNREMADKFAVDWSRKSMKGHTISDCQVSIYGITDELKIWIDEYVKKLNDNQQPN